jgi:catechol 2,3-dioxygenase-like lactoylglutathione lyase family enzyme
MPEPAPAAIPVIQGIAPYIEVFDMPTSLAFYRDILGFTLKASSGEGDDVDWVLLEQNEHQFMLNTAYEKINRPPHPDPLRIKGHRDTAFYFWCPDPDALHAYLTSKGVQAKEPYITGYGWKAVSLKDPDGYGLCFHCPLNK